jgi:exopolysaccharide biosynthesis WecB/TagA/CpsF family protein
MPVVLVALLLVVLVAMAIAFRHLSPVGVAVATVTIGYVLGHAFWHTRVGPLPLTVDRLLLGVLAAVVTWYFLKGRIGWRKPLAVDWAVVVLLCWLSVSCVANNLGANGNLPTSPYFRLLFSFWIPALLYLAVRLAPLSTRTVTAILTALTVLGCYLAVTACAEITGQWWAVFPKYIGDPELGAHFGRARGPALNSVSMGNYLCVALWSAWTLRPRVTRGWQLVLLAAMGLMVLAVFFTFTRSVWMGLALSGLVMLIAHTPRRRRWPVAGVATGVAVLGAAVAWSFVLNLSREDSGQVSQHSVQQRTAFAYVSWNMFCDEPLTGVGFGRFYDKKLPYLADRSQEFELESIRHLHHHNTLLGLLTESGMIGLAAYLAALVGWCLIGCRMAFGDGHSVATRQMGRLLLAVLAVYLPSAAFHDVSHIYQDQWLVLLVVGLAVATAEQAAGVQPMGITAPSRPRLRAPLVPTVTAAPRGTTSADTSRVSLFGMNIDRVDLRQATERVLAWCSEPATSTCRYVVTPNVDHAVLLTHHTGLRKAYASAAMVLADGAPIVAASKILGRALPERVAGSDLVPSLLRAADGRQRPLRVFLLGAGPGVAQRAAINIQRQYPGVQVVGTHCPPLGFEHDSAANQAAIDAVGAAKPDMVIIGLGAPKQELWIEQVQHVLAARVAVCAGATIDFLAGEKRRSPLWMQRLGLEWLHRLSTEPRRLARRYFRDAVVFPRLVWQEWRGVQA